MAVRVMVTAMVVLLMAGSALAASRTLVTDCRGRLNPGAPRHHHEREHPWCRHPFSFAMEVLTDGGPVDEGTIDGRPVLYIREGQTYTIRLHNPLPVRVAVNLTVDGLNTISGKPGSPSEGAKWVLDPCSQTVIEGWQVGHRRARRFVFTSKEDSYARWRSRAWGRDLSANCGVIGAAFFWSAAELAAAMPHQPERRIRDYAAGTAGGRTEAERAGAPAPRFEAGTGQGESVCHPVHEVSFLFDTGMYRAEDAVLVYYDFPGHDYPPPTREPLYEPHRQGRSHQEYAPEMPRPWSR